MTKFTTLKAEIKKKKKETEFTHVVNESNKTIDKTDIKPECWDNVLYLGGTPGYGDMFKAWDDDTEIFGLYFGVKGDEFD
jgi:hypothetical protein